MFTLTCVQNRVAWNYWKTKIGRASRPIKASLCMGWNKQIWNQIEFASNENNVQKKLRIDFSYCIWSNQFAPLLEPIHEPNKQTTTLWNSDSPSSWCGISISCQEGLWQRSNVQTSPPLWEFQEWQATCWNVKLSHSTIARAHSWAKQTDNNTLKQWQSIILVWHINILPGRLVTAVGSC